MADRENIRRKKLVEYFRANISKGYSVDSLKWALIRQGNSRFDVEYAIEQVKDEMPKKAEQEKPKVAQEVHEEVSVVQEKPWWKFW